MNSSAELTIDLRQMIFAIETAVSLVGMNDTNHGKRVGYIASQLGHTLGFSDADNQFAFELGLLHDSGVSTEQVHASLVNHFDWNEAYIHCEIGFQLLNSFPPLARFALPIRYHHTPWNELDDHALSTQDKRMANLIFLADRIDILSSSHYSSDILIAKNDIVKTIQSYSGTFFNPAFVDAFVEISRSEAFWIALEDRHITRYAWDMGQITSEEILTLPQIKQLSLIMSYIVDQKSPFTAEHSIRVAELAKFLAEAYGLSSVQCDKIEIAGLLHDIGKLHTPDNILEKPALLDSFERSIMDQHSYETFEILRHIKGLGEIAKWAAFHHEGINGAGYPFHPSEKELGTEARIIAVADVFQALVQDRPYREGLTLKQVTETLREQSESGKLDKSIVELAIQRGWECFNVARTGTTDGSESSQRIMIEKVISDASQAETTKL